MHARTVIHRDVKLENIMVVPANGELLVKLVDLGVATDIYSPTITQVDCVVGSPMYLAPEVVDRDMLLDDERIDGRIDIYAAGVCLYYMLCRQFPFVFDKREDTTQQLMHIVQEVPKPPHEVNPDVPTLLSRIAMKCLEKKRGNRFADAPALKTALLDAANELGLDVIYTEPVASAELKAVESGVSELPRVVPVIKPRRNLAGYVLATAALVISAAVTFLGINALRSPQNHLSSTRQRTKLQTVYFNVTIAGPPGASISVIEVNGDGVHWSRFIGTIGATPFRTELKQSELLVQTVEGGSIMLRVDGNTDFDLKNEHL
jgi:serine/threonine protein kinase